jgi:hypothetical protein
MKMKNVTLWAGAGAALFLAGPVSAEVLAYWSFNTNDGDLYSWEADVGAGTLTLDLSWTNVSLSTGSELNAMPGHAAGDALNLRGQGNNGRNIDFSASTTGYGNIAFSFDAERNSPGFNGNQIWYSLDGVHYDMFSPYGPPTEYATMSFDMSSITELNDAAEVYIRIRFNGASNNGGRNLIDNVRIAGSVIPAPGVTGMLAVGAVLTGPSRRRRR